ncbi:MAG TPA: carbon-nitrogen hydrolase [Candidatus Hydrogenedentes bacterium]|nr:carbon-nitrogen hydrolase [Candidatus Hydrogenedentota bacterium]
MSRTIKAGLVQQACSDDKEATIAKTIAGIREAAGGGAELVVLQELHTGPYFCQTEDPSHFARAESIPGPTSDRLGGLAGELGIVLVASLFEKRAPGLYHNTAVVLDRDGSIAGLYRKMHIPEDPGFNEKFYFAPGDLGFKPIQTSAGVLGVLVCWDQWYPEAARLMALAGAEMLIYPTAIGWVPEDSDEERARQREAWLIVQRGHAIANHLPVVAANRVGFEAHPGRPGEGILFFGSSFIAGPQGELLASASPDREEVLTAEIDLDRTEEVRRLWPFFRDRRVDAYNGLLERYLDSG